MNVSVVEQEDTVMTPSSFEEVPVRDDDDDDDERSSGAVLSDGLVVRLHFACRAALPHGSSLRVTSSSLWAPERHAQTDGGDGGIVDSSVYASSVEMTTTPETWPLWRTTVPALVVLHDGAADARRRAGSVGSGASARDVLAGHRETTTVGAAETTTVDDDVRLRHRYRYVVITPGAQDEERRDSLSDMATEMSETNNDDDEDDDETTPFDQNSALLWEDPFEVLSRAVDGVDRENDDENTGMLTTFAGLPSQQKIKKARCLKNLPFRTRTVRKQGDVVTTDNREEGGRETNEYTEDGVPVDTWNRTEDASFVSYRDREAVRLRHLEAAAKASTEGGGGDSEDVVTTAAAAVESKEDDGVRRRLFMVCFHLPVSIARDPTDPSIWTAAWNESLLSKSTGRDTRPDSLSGTYDRHYVGTVSTNPPTVFSEADREAVRVALRPMGCTPLFLDPAIEEAHYLGMCKQVLWPAFHNVDLLDLSTSGWGQKQHLAPPTIAADPATPATVSANNTTSVRSTIDSDWDQSRLDKWWEAYTVVNQTFADALAGMDLNKDDTTWVHDYHLSLLPRMLCETGEDMDVSSHGGNKHNTANPTCKMVFFLHIPFPTSQIFRELECGEAILEGMLHADVIGFHAFDHARHFLNAAKRILGLTYESLVGGLIGIKYGGRTVLVTMSNVSIEPDVVDRALRALPPEDALRARHGDRRIVAGVDVAQRLSGITFKLLAYERLLTDYPVWQNKVVMVQRCLVPGSRRADEANTVREVRFLVRRIQEAFGRHVIDYAESAASSLPLPERAALWRAADCLMLTPVREGLNLSPMEYVHTRSALSRLSSGDASSSSPGVVVASEFSAVVSILNGALRVNPFDIQATATCIDKALSMEEEERVGRHARDVEFVSHFPKDKWTANVLRDLHEATAMTAVDGGGGDESRDADEESLKTGDFLAREHERSFARIDPAAVAAAYRASSRRVVFLDFNGTIVMKEPQGKYLKRDILGTSCIKPPSAVLHALAVLAADPRNTVFVVSGDSQENVENAVGRVPGLGLAASNGACFSDPVFDADDDGASSSSHAAREWETFDLGVDWAGVKEVSLPVLSKYTARTNGSYVKLTHSSIGWSYYSSDPEWGSLQAAQLVDELEAELADFDVRLVTLKGVVEIVPRRLTKGLIVEKVLREAANKGEGGPPDFVLCVGDDVSDEKMFSSVFSFVANMSEGALSGWSPTMRTDSGHLLFSKETKKAATAQQDRATAATETRRDGEDANDDRPTYCYTVTVGKKPSLATRYANDVRDVANLLLTMTGGDERTAKKLRSQSFDGNHIGVEYFA